MDNQIAFSVGFFRINYSVWQTTRYFYFFFWHRRKYQALLMWQLRVVAATKDDHLITQVNKTNESGCTVYKFNLIFWTLFLGVFVMMTVSSIEIDPQTQSHIHAAMFGGETGDSTDVHTT